LGGCLEKLSSAGVRRARIFMPDVLCREGQGLSFGKNSDKLMRFS
jgi:hypothetical protein